MISLYVTMIKQQNNSWSTRILSFLFQFVVTVCGLNHYIVLSVLTTNRISWTIPSYTKWRIIHDGVQTDQVAIISNYILIISLSIGTTYREFFSLLLFGSTVVFCVCVCVVYTLTWAEIGWILFEVGSQRPSNTQSVFRFNVRFSTFTRVLYPERYIVNCFLKRDWSI